MSASDVHVEPCYTLVRLGCVCHPCFTGWELRTRCFGLGELIGDGRSARSSPEVLRCPWRGGRGATWAQPWQPWQAQSHGNCPSALKPVPGGAPAAARTLRKAGAWPPALACIPAGLTTQVPRRGCCGCGSTSSFWFGVKSAGWVEILKRDTAGEQDPGSASFPTRLRACQENRATAVFFGGGVLLSFLCEVLQDDFFFFCLWQPRRNCIF